MDKKTFEALGRHDPLKQHEWCKERDRELRKLWKCSCGEPLPVKGNIWKERWENFRLGHRLGQDPTGSVWSCHVCVGKREIGIDDEIHS